MSEVQADRREFDAAVLTLARAIKGAFRHDIAASESGLASLIRDALGTKRVTDDLAELLRMPVDAVIAELRGMGLPVAGQVRPDTAPEEAGVGWTAADGVVDSLAPGISIEALHPAFSQAFSGDADRVGQLETEWASYLQRLRSGDAFLDFYRKGVAEYASDFLNGQWHDIQRFIRSKFPRGIGYLVTVGIGANEQFWGYPRTCYEQERRAGAVRWLICDNPKDLVTLPEGANLENTLFLLFSRSGKTQEILKVFEFLPGAAVRVVFANSGPLHDAAAGRPDTCLVCPIVDEIPGRFGKNRTPMLLAPLGILGVDVTAYWAEIENAIRAWDLADVASPPVTLARYLRAAQVLNGANHIYLGTNDTGLISCADEFVQFWNEGVNRSGNDFLVSRYFGLPRDSHLNIEGVLGNHETKVGLFLLRRDGNEVFHGPFLNRTPTFLNPNHNGLTVARVDYALARANADRFGELMPTVVIELERPSLRSSALLSQLWTDAVFCYARMTGLNPGSNPEVRHVRDRADALLSSRHGKASTHRR